MSLDSCGWTSDPPAVGLSVSAGFVGVVDGVAVGVAVAASVVGGVTAAVAVGVTAGALVGAVGVTAGVLVGAVVSNASSILVFGSTLFPSTVTFVASDVSVSCTLPLV